MVGGRARREGRIQRVRRVRLPRTAASAGIEAGGVYVDTNFPTEDKSCPHLARTMHKKLFLVGALTSLIFVGCEDSPSGSADEIKFTALDEPPGPNCREGGSRLEIQRGEKVDLVYLCHPAQGSGAISVSEAGERCPHGGSLIHIEGAEPIALCDGKDGSPPATLIVEPIEPGEECASGGASIRVGEGEPILVCQGHTETVSIATEPPGENCAAGGIKLEVGSREPVFICSGLDGEGVTLSPSLPENNARAAASRSRRERASAMSVTATRSLGISSRRMPRPSPTQVISTPPTAI